MCALCGGVPVLIQCRAVRVLGSLGAGRRWCRCRVCLGAGVLVPLQGATAVCAWELGCWCRAAAVCLWELGRCSRCRVPPPCRSSVPLPCAAGAAAKVFLLSGVSAGVGSFVPIHLCARDLGCNSILLQTSTEPSSSWCVFKVACVLRSQWKSQLADVPTGSERLSEASLAVMLFVFAS